MAEEAAVKAHRSPPQQIEHWAQIGRVIEKALSYPAETAIKRVGRPELDSALKAALTPAGIKKSQENIRRRSGKIVSAD